MTTANLRELESEIERLVAEHVAACQQAAAAAVQRAFGAASGIQSRRPKHAGQAQPRSANNRRTAEQVTELAERFYSAVCANPGETMRVLSAQVGASARDLHRPVRVLKREGLVRSAGQRQHTRYFPMTMNATASS